MKTTGRPRKADRNKLIYKLRKQGKTFPELAKMFGLKSRSRIADIYYREVLERGK